MVTSTKALIAGVVALACAGGVYAAARDVHVMKVALSDGSVAQIHYVGDVAPQVVLAPAATPVTLSALDSPFAMMDQVAAEMDRQSQAMLQQVATLQEQAARAPQVQTASMGAAAPQGVYHYSYVSTSGGQGGCTQSYELTSYGNAAPKEVSQQSGDCKGVAPLVKTAVPATPAPPASAAKPMLTSAKPAPVTVSRDSI